MRRQTLLLAAVGAFRAHGKAFSVQDDVLAMPQYEIVFSDTYILDHEAEASLLSAASLSSARAQVASTVSASKPTPSGELSTFKHGSGESTGDSTGTHILTDAESFEYMVLDRAPYLCALPSVAAAPNRTERAKTKDDEARELARATDTGWELLKELEGKCMYFASGWWSYSFCYNNQVKQFHALQPGKNNVPAFPPVEDESVPSFVLGRFEGNQRQPAKDLATGASKESQQNQKQSSSVARVQSKGDVRYMVQDLYGGSICDITNRPRKVEVQFHCHPQSSDRIGWIKEVSTCAYLMVIYTPRLCNDVAFQPPKTSESQKIVCREVLRPEDVGTWKSKKAAETARRLEGSSGGTTGSSKSGRPVVGGIEVGGMKTVGQEGKRIDAPTVFHPAEQPGEIVARWSPTEHEGKVQQLNKEQLRELDLSPAIVDEMREELQKLSDNRPWRLEVVENPGGMRELRGIVDTDEDDDQLAEGTGDQNGANTDGDGSKEHEGSQETYKDEL